MADDHTGAPVFLPGAKRLASRDDVQGLPGRALLERPANFSERAHNGPRVRANEEPVLKPNRFVRGQPLSIRTRLARLGGRPTPLRLPEET